MAHVRDPRRRGRRVAEGRRRWPVPDHRGRAAYDALGGRQTTGSCSHPLRPGPSRFVLWAAGNSGSKRHEPPATTALVTLGRWRARSAAPGDAPGGPRRAHGRRGRRGRRVHLPPSAPAPTNGAASTEAVAGRPRRPHPRPRRRRRSAAAARPGRPPHSGSRNGASRTVLENAAAGRAVAWADLGSTAAAFTSSAARRRVARRPTPTRSSPRRPTGTPSRSCAPTRSCRRRRTPGGRGRPVDPARRIPPVCCRRPREPRRPDPRHQHALGRRHHARAPRRAADRRRARPEPAVQPDRRPAAGGRPHHGEPRVRPLTQWRPTQGGDSFGADASSLAGMRDAGFDVLVLANNHLGDYGDRALRKILAAARGGFAMTGAGENLAAALEPAVVERKGVRIGVLAFNAIGETPAASASSAGALWVRMPPPDRSAEQGGSRPGDRRGPRAARAGPTWSSSTRTGARSTSTSRFPSSATSGGGSSRPARRRSSGRTRTGSRGWTSTRAGSSPTGWATSSST